MAGEKVKDSARRYTVMAERELNLGDSKSFDELREEFGKDTKVELFVKIGGAVGASPKAAIQALASARDINGAVAIVSDSAFNRMTAKTETKRVVELE